MDRLSSRVEREWPETSNFSNFPSLPSPSPSIVRRNRVEIGLKEAGGVFERVRNQRRKEGRKEERTGGGGYSRLIEDASRLESRSAAILETRLREGGRRNAINSQSEFSSPPRGEFAVPRYFKQLPKSIRSESNSNFVKLCRS